MIQQIPCLLRELDWNTPLRRVKCRDHWRVYLVAAICTLPTFVVWWILFPHTIWIMKLFGAFATGGIVGIVIGHAWQLAAPSRRARTSGRHLVWSVFCGWAIFLPLALFFVGPVLHSEEMELMKIRSLKESDIAAICVQVPGEPQTRTTKRVSVISFVRKCHRSSLFYVGHEPFTNKARLTLDFVDDTAWTYEAGIPERHPRDLVITFRPHMQHSYILIPDAAKWFESQGAMRTDSGARVGRDADQAKPKRDSGMGKGVGKGSKGVSP